MNNLKIETVDSVLVVDSRLIAEELGIEHKSFIKTIQKYEVELLMFDQLRFRISTVTNSTGAINEAKFVYLTEDQATFVMTLSRNTEQVVKCKLELVKKFSEAKKLLSKPMSPAEILMEQAKALLALEQEQELLKKQLALESQRTNSLESLVIQHDAELDRIFNANGHYYSIMGYCSLFGKPISVSEASNLGRKASKLCKEYGYSVVPISDPRFGKVNSYPEVVLSQII